MALTKFTGAVNNIQSLSDRPNEIDGLTSAELKERFDKAGADIKDYLNNVLTEEVESLIPTDYVHENDTRLTNSRQCNNSFDNWETARGNLKISYGTTLPSSADDGAIFLLYK